MSIADKRQTFRRLHESGCFVIPNPWNVGSARYLQGLGFNALATTSSGYAPAGLRPVLLGHPAARSAALPPIRRQRRFLRRSNGPGYGYDLMVNSLVANHGP